EIEDAEERHSSRIYLTGQFSNGRTWTHKSSYILRTPCKHMYTSFYDVKKLGLRVGLIAVRFLNIRAGT
ncbi:hypothetical protein K501DRAFT_287137, partial [Backusella circina FSU 941]